MEDRKQHAWKIEGTCMPWSTSCSFVVRTFLVGNIFSQRQLLLSRPAATIYHKQQQATRKVASDFPQGGACTWHGRLAWWTDEQKTNMRRWVRETKGRCREAHRRPDNGRSGRWTLRSVGSSRAMALSGYGRPQTWSRRDRKVVTAWSSRPQSKGVVA